MTGRTTGSISADHQRRFFRPRVLKYLTCLVLMLALALLGDRLPRQPVLFGAYLVVMAPPTALCLWYGFVALLQGLGLVFGYDA